MKPQDNFPIPIPIIIIIGICVVCFLGFRASRLFYDGSRLLSLLPKREGNEMVADSVAAENVIDVIDALADSAARSEEFVAIDDAYDDTAAVDTAYAEPIKRATETVVPKKGDNETKYFEGTFTYGGQSFTVKLAVLISENGIRSVVYKNVKYGTKLNMQHNIKGDVLYLRNNDFTMELRETVRGVLEGTASDKSGKVMEVYLRES